MPGLSKTPAPAARTAAPAKAARPAVKAAAPAAKAAAPAAQAVKPAGKAAAPVKTAAPAVKTAAPAVKTAAPAVKTAPPAVKTPAPAVKTAAPVKTSAPAAAKNVMVPTKGMSDLSVGSKKTLAQALAEKKKNSMNNPVNLKFALTEQEKKSPVWKAMCAASAQSEALEKKKVIKPFNYVFPRGAVKAR